MMQEPFAHGALRIFDSSVTGVYLLKFEGGQQISSTLLRHPTRGQSTIWMLKSIMMWMNNGALLYVDFPGKLMLKSFKSIIAFAVNGREKDIKYAKETVSFILLCPLCLWFHVYQPI